MERTYINCKHWMFPLCPQKSNESMRKTEGRKPPIQYLTPQDLDIINKLCLECPVFEEKN